MSVFVNLSNHHSEKWGEKQYQAAKEYGEIIDLPFPNIRSDASEDEVSELVEIYFRKILEFEQPVVMIQGEFTFTVGLVIKLKENGIIALSSCTERKASNVVNEDGISVKTSVFEFVKFRRY